MTHSYLQIQNPHKHLVRSEGFFNYYEISGEISPNSGKRFYHVKTRSIDNNEVIMNYEDITYQMGYHRAGGTSLRNRCIAIAHKIDRFCTLSCQFFIPFSLITIGIAAGCGAYMGIKEIPRFDPEGNLAAVAAGIIAFFMTTLAVRTFYSIKQERERGHTCAQLAYNLVRTTPKNIIHALQKVIDDDNLSSSQHSIKAPAANSNNQQQDTVIEIENQEAEDSSSTSSSASVVSINIEDLENATPSPSSSFKDKQIPSITITTAEENLV